MDEISSQQTLRQAAGEGPGRRPRALRDVGAEPPPPATQQPTTQQPITSQPSTPQKPAALPVGETGYHHFLRTGRRGWWRGALAILLTCVSFFAVQVVLTVPLVVLQAVTGMELVSVDPTAPVLTPALLVVTNVSIGLMIPISIGLQRLLFGQPGRWLHSVHGRFRWRLAGRLAAVLLPIWVVYALVITTVAPEAAGAGGPAPTLTSTLTILLVVVLTTPFQAAGEEYAARGLITRSIGSWFANPRTAMVAAVLGTNLLFMAAHGAGDWTLAGYYLLFGVACSIITWRTGGIEAAVVLHAVNNVVLFGIAAFISSELSIDRSAGSGGAIMLVPLAMMALATAGIWLWSGRRGLARTADPSHG